MPHAEAYQSWTACFIMVAHMLDVTHNDTTWWHHFVLDTDMSRSSGRRISGAGAHTLSPPAPMPQGTSGLKTLRTLLVFELDAGPRALITPTPYFNNLGGRVMPTLGIGCCPADLAQMIVQAARELHQARHVTARPL
jgi:hypothetical protein